ncbi:type III pantothenate kinase [Blattabacterium cuenoti]|uniref:type III pantothenate kinase n=1 Tax=Blattabacterium cuenoti TaxID=1653831 RepID=UPI00163BCCB5|nr:type III pantothenate kinase [Blattabacterium cuenoti]
MLLTINIGNSSIRFGVFHNKNFDIKCYQSWYIQSNLNLSLDKYIIILKKLYEKNLFFSKKIRNIVIGSVVPNLTKIIDKSLYKIYQIKPIIVNQYSFSPVKHCSHQLGTDLYANAIAAYTLYGKKDILIVDFGTVLSLICVNKYGMIKGVIIAPGISSSLSSLIRNTSLLSSKITIEKPPMVLGKCTKTCIQSGMVYGFLSMVEGLINKINNELKTNCFVISTGGFSHIYFPLTEQIHINDKNHTMKGLKVLFHLNHK